MTWERLRAYGLAAAGVIVITGAIGILRRWVDQPTLTVAYVVLVIYVGASSGRLPALFAAGLSFVVYEFFFVPPYGSLVISAPRDVLSLVVLLAAAAVSEQLVAALVRQSAGAEAKARESQSLYEVALAALRETDAQAALEVLVRSAAREPGITSVTVLADASGGGFDVLAGDPPTRSDLESARWTVQNGRSLGARLTADRLAVFEQVPPAPAYVRLPGGVAVVRIADQGPGADGERVLGALAGMIALLLDRRRGREQARRADELEQSDKLKAGVLAALTHEVKTPLASLQAGISALELDRRLAADQRSDLAGLEAQTIRLDRLVQNVLTMSRLETGRPAEREPHDVDDLVGAAIRSSSHLLKPFEVTVDVPAGLPPVLGDEVLLERVFANLLENATQWTPDGGRISVSARSREGSVEVAVENQGQAIPAHALGDVFSTHWTLREQGSGLGLAISRQIVEAHGGRIAVRNTRSGPRFTVILPAAGVPASP